MAASIVFTNVIRCSRLPLWVGYFNCFKFTRVSSIVYQSLHLWVSYWLINKRMCVLLFDVFKHLPLRKTDVLKTCRKSKFLGKKIWRNAWPLKSKKVHGIIEKTFILTFYLQLSFVCKTVSHISFKLFCSDISEFLRKWGWFQGYN